jgi:hypothetical protein
MWWLESDRKAFTRTFTSGRITDLASGPQDQMSDSDQCLEVFRQMPSRWVVALWPVARSAHPLVRLSNPPLEGTLECAPPPPPSFWRGGANQQAVGRWCAYVKEYRSDINMSKVHILTTSRGTACLLSESKNSRSPAQKRVRDDSDNGGFEMTVVNSNTSDKSQERFG